MKISNFIARLFRVSAKAAIALLLIANFNTARQSNAALPLAAAPPIVAQNPADLNYARLGIGGVRLGSSIEEAKRKFGKPQRDESKPAPGLGGTIRTINYPGVAVAAFDGRNLASS